jgi:hypothetical protein
MIGSVALLCVDFFWLIVITYLYARNYFEIFSVQDLLCRVYLDVRYLSIVLFCRILLHATVQTSV